MKRIIKVLAGGRFNKLHPGHSYFLEKAKSLGDYLIVVVAHDAHNRHGKTPMHDRKANVESLGIADKVVIGYPDSFVRTLQEERPNIIALGYDQQLPADATKEIMDKYKIRAVRIEKFGNYSVRHNILE